MARNHFKEEVELHEKLKHLLVRCKKCGHTMLMPVQMDYTICTHCGNKVLNNTMLYFKYKLRKEIENVKQK